MSWLMSRHCCIDVATLSWFHHLGCFDLMSRHWMFRSPVFKPWLMSLPMLWQCRDIADLCSYSLSLMSRHWIFGVVVLNDVIA